MNVQRDWIAFKLKSNAATFSGITGVNTRLFVKLSQSCSMDCLCCFDFTPKPLQTN
jgi:hypothetical protein